MEKSTKPAWISLPISAMRKADGIALAAVLALAVILRTLFYTGFFGSDEVTYVETAVKIASGDWRASNYIGATRYGMNLPVALSIYLFGLSETSANLWPFLCSIGEVAIIFSIARWLWSTRVAILSAGLLALLPLHVHFAGRMMADSPLAFFLSLSVALLLYASHSRRPIAFIVAGLAWGGVFWVKESVALLYSPVFLFLAVYLNRFDTRWFWMFAGMIVAVLANCTLMYFVSGNPMHLIAAMKSSIATFVGMTTVETSPWYYFHYLFMDVRHTLLLGFLALGGIILYFHRVVRNGRASISTQFVVLWVLLIVGMFSFAIVSFSPVKFVMKQTNYMLIFIGPMSLLAGWFMASLPKRLFMAVFVLTTTGSLVLIALEQQAITVFTANSKAAYVFLTSNPNAILVGTSNNQRAINFFSIMEDHRALSNQAVSFGELATNDESHTPIKMLSKAYGKDIFTVLDLQNIEWSGHMRGGTAIRRLSDVPKCWESIGTLIPAALGSGRIIVKAFEAMGVLLPDSLSPRYMSVLKPVSSPSPAYIFRTDYSCLAKTIF